MQVNWSALLQPGVQLEEWQREKLQETVAAMSYQLGSSAMPWLQASLARYLIFLVILTTASMSLAMCQARSFMFQHPTHTEDMQVSPK